jgi:signal transduction histidine kinase
MADGLGVLEMTDLQHQAMLTLLSCARTLEEAIRIVKASAELCPETLAPFEIAHRGFQHATAALRRLNDLLEQEACRIAHALHGEAAQLLAPLHFALSEVLQELPPTAHQLVLHAQGLLDQIGEQLRRLSHELHPTVLDDLGLLPALEFLAKGISKRTGLSIIVEGSMERRLPMPIETALYRIVQESLLNAVRHARARTVKVVLHQSSQEIQCAICDDGTGFDVSLVCSRNGERGLGISGIRERLNSLGGDLQIDSVQGRGTEVRVTIPVEVQL